MSIIFLNKKDKANIFNLLQNSLNISMLYNDQNQLNANINVLVLKLYMKEIKIYLTLE